MDTWESEVIISGLTSPSDMWLTDMDDDGLVDVVSADHTVHRGVWHKNPGIGSNEPWQLNSIFQNVRMPGDFAMVDMDKDGDLDWVGTSMTWGQVFIVEQVEPETSLVATISLPDDFDEEITRVVLLLSKDYPLKGIPKSILANIENIDKDGDGELDVDQLINASNEIVLALEDVGEIGDYHVVAALYVEGGGNFNPKSGIDYMASSGMQTVGNGKVEVVIDLVVAP